VSSTSAERFAAKVAARRRHRITITLAVATVLTLLGWVVLASPWLRVRDVQVVGTERLDPRALAALASGDVGRPLLLADTTSVTARVEAMRLVRSARVTRVWPSTLRITVVERRALAAVPRGGSLSLVDGEGVEVATGRQVPPGLPLVRVDLAVAGPAALRAAVDVVDGLPDALRADVLRIGATSPDRVWMDLRDGSRVEWGSADDTPRKAQVLAALRAQGATLYDVSSPDTPAVKGSR
jgi:cell division protein FtsQ